MNLARPIVGEKVDLRMLDPDADFAAYLGWLNDPDVTRFLEVRFHDHSPSSIRGYVQTCNDSTNTLLLGIFVSRKGRHVGNVKLGPIDLNHKRGDIGIMIGDKSAWGGGIATETLRLLCDHAFLTLDLHKLTAGFYAGNSPAIRAFQKAGFAQAAVLPQHRLFEGQWVDQVLVHRINGEGQ